MNEDPVITHLDLIARTLESMGYGVEVDYTGATIIVWLENWPALVKVKQQNERSEYQFRVHASACLPLPAHAEA